MLHKIFIAGMLSALCLNTFSQQCGNCGRTPSLAQYNFIIKAGQTEFNSENNDQEIQQLQNLARLTNSTLSDNNKNCIRFTQQHLQDQADNESDQSSKYGKYIVTGNITKNADSYLMHVEIQTTCNKKTVVASDVPFKLSDDLTGVAQQAAANLSPLIEKIKAFELREREENNEVALGNSQEGDDIIIVPVKRNLSPGGKTEINLTLKDCDGTPLANRKISFANGSVGGLVIKGTIGGTVTPSEITTDQNGKAKATFTMGGDNAAIINAHTLFKLPTGCADVKVGSIPIGGIKINQIPVKVTIDHESEEETVLLLEKATMPGVVKKGGNQTISSEMFHRTILYHYPSQVSLKQGYLISAGRESSMPGTKTEYVLETGHFEYSDNTGSAEISGMAGNIEMVHAKEKGTSVFYVGVSSLRDQSEVQFFKGDNMQPAEISWSIQYPASDGNIASGGMYIVKCDPGVQWDVKPVTDPNSPYKTEYTLKLEVDVAKETAEGSKNMKEWIGLSTEGLAKVSGYRRLTVKILSPYAPDEKDCQ
jgi:hypothetical protein